MDKAPSARTSPELSQNRVLTLAPRVSAAFGGSRSIMGRTSPVGLPLFIALDPHAGSGGGLGRRRSIRRRISANSARGTATSASWNVAELIVLGRERR
jgi:hypothetical protein